MTDIARRGFLTLIGAAIATPAMAKTAGGVMVPVPQKLVADRLVLRGMVVSGIDIIDCHIISGGMPGIRIEGCRIEGSGAPGLFMHMNHIVGNDWKGDYPALVVDNPSTS